MTKPMGPIPPDFGSDAGMLTIAGCRADDLVAQAGDTPLFVYDLGAIERRIARFRAAFGPVHLHYAMKANPYPPLLKHVWNLVDGVDLASGGELKIALDAGVDAEATSFAGPGKRDSDLEAAITAGVALNCESEGEAERALRTGDRLGRTPRLAVRVNPDFEIKGSGMRMGGGAKPFGVDAERVPALVKRIVSAGADFRGYHIFAGSQALSAEALIEAQGASVLLARTLTDAAGFAAPLVNLGGGFGIPYFHGEQPVDVEAIAAALHQSLESDATPGTEYAIELGRWLVGECGVYLTRVVDRKVSHGKTFLVVDGGMHHQLAASGNFGQLVRRNYPVAIANRFGLAGEEDVTIVGCLCTPLDRLGDDVMTPKAEVGDLVAVFLAGAYGLSASPQAFLGQQAAREMVVGGAR
ncbi:MAG TPA: pyridoxal-dependent decarboxylase, exosortase A system-associated [Allosphingosinicella sp.]|jgi:diaminopimelate decarboxylase|nr:pyridoxal-dependent decarboxylase, exosortase A system-associated [Allosphingosinicella sp.]